MPKFTGAAWVLAVGAAWFILGAVLVRSFVSSAVLSSPKQLPFTPNTVLPTTLTPTVQQLMRYHSNTFIREPILRRSSAHHTAAVIPASSTHRRRR